jgi:hypothetical protein
VPAAVAEAPDTTTTKQQVEDPTKLEQSGEPEAEKKKTKRAGSKATGAKAAGTKATGSKPTGTKAKKKGDS